MINVNDEDNKLVTFKQSDALIMQCTTFKMTLIATFQKKPPFLLWNANSYNPNCFDLIRVGFLDLLGDYGFNLSDLRGTGGGMSSHTIVLKKDSYISTKESMITTNIRKTETDVSIKSLSDELIIDILSQVDRRKFLKNGAEPEDLYIKITPENHPLENKIKKAYSSVGFHLLEHDPTMTDIRFFMTEAYTIYRMGIFNYTQKVINDFVSKSQIPKQPELCEQVENKDKFSP